MPAAPDAFLYVFDQQGHVGWPKCSGGHERTSRQIAASRLDRGQAGVTGGLACHQQEVEPRSAEVSLAWHQLLKGRISTLGQQAKITATAVQPSTTQDFISPRPLSIVEITQSVALRLLERHNIMGHGAPSFQ